MPFLHRRLYHSIDSPAKRPLSRSKASWFLSSQALYLNFQRHDGTLPSGQFVRLAARTRRHPVVAAKVAHFSFHPTLFVPLAGRAELSFIPPVRTEGNETRRQLAFIPAQNLLHRSGQVVVAKFPENPAEVVKGRLMGFQKCLLGSSRDDTLPRCPWRASRTPAASLVRRSGPPRLHASPPGLPRPSCNSAAQNLAHRQAQFPLPLFHVLAHRALGCCAARHFRAYPFPDAAGRVPLFARCLTVLFQNRLDEPWRWNHLRPWPLGLLSPRGHGTVDRQGSSRRFWKRTV